MKEKLMLGAVCAIVTALLSGQRASAQNTYNVTAQNTYNLPAQIEAAVVQQGGLLQLPRYYWVVEVQYIFVGYDTTYWGTRLETYDQQEALEYYLLALTAKQNGLLDQMFPPQGRWHPIDVRWRKVDRFVAITGGFRLFMR